MIIKNKSLKTSDIENEVNPVEKLFGFPEILEDFNEPFIVKLVKQQEELNRFRDICNPGISYGLYYY